MMNNVTNTKVITDIVRLSYANVWEPKSINGGAEKYSVSLIIPKSDTKTIEAIERAVDAAIEEGKKKHGRSFPNKQALKLPLRDGDIDRPGDDAYADSYFVNANSVSPPQIVDQSVAPILNRSDVYSGVYARVSVNFYPFASQNKGIACGLGNIQKIKDGEPLGGKASAASDFSSVPTDDFLS
ncbi:DUF2815 family protein [[Bacillus] selenitireducens]|uniref:Phage-associated protein n=2 Tax=Salisediminibacterium selenitireducens TaxID=85683 RepID=D6XYZ1_BACIE|nr:hypothetical protein Bsel_0770 [[Bacillus] selenitireducens MLS10]